MTVRFRRSIKIMPGVRVNFGKRGMSVSAGIRGANITAGKRGVYGNVGIPGTGLSFRDRLTEKQHTKRASQIVFSGILDRITLKSNFITVIN